MPRPDSKSAMNDPSMSLADGGAPLYQRVKDAIIGHLVSGRWPEGSRVPSENEMTQALGISRMTVNRALRELTSEGWLVRVQGAGTFVAEAKPQSAVMEIRSIAEEIGERGNRHRAEVHLLDQAAAGALEGRLLGIDKGGPVFHSLILHRENDVPVQLEERYVNPAAAPDYLSQDFTAITPYDYLIAVAPLTQAEHTIMAVLPGAGDAALLEIDPTSPCLLVRRRTWSGDRAVTWARLLHPGQRYRLGSSFKASGSALGAV
jgi:GntR family histidine utilization transcriptional repressor